jgi:hypothetical protein
MTLLKKLRKQPVLSQPPIASAYRLSTRILTLSDLINQLSGLDHLLHLKRRLRNWWHETRDPTCKTALNWVTKTIHRMTRRNATERWEAKTIYSEVTPHAIWPLEESVMKSDSPKAPTIIYGPSGLKFRPLEKANAIANCLENQFTPHDLCEENHERRMEARVQTSSEVVDDSSSERVRPCDLQKLIKYLKLRKACGIDGIPKECFRHLPTRPLIHLTHLFNHCLRLSHFSSSWKEAKVINLPKPGMDQNSLSSYDR